MGLDLIASADFARENNLCALSEHLNNTLDQILTLLNSATACLFFETICFIYAKPTELFLDSAGRLHHEEKAATEFIDGTKYFVWHGVEVPEDVIMHPHKIKVKGIENERNVEIRRIMIERYGLNNFIRDSAARVVQRDEFGTLYRKELPGEEPVVVVRVENSTAEHDGEYKNYYLRVPPHIQTAREAVAWTEVAPVHRRASLGTKC